MTDKEPGIIHLKVGEKYTLRLKGKATSGYEWQAAVSNKKNVAIKKEFIEQKAKENILAGENSDEQLTITALKKGKTKINLVLSRSWEKEGKPADEKKYILIAD